MRQGEGLASSSLSAADSCGAMPAPAFAVKCKGVTRTAVAVADLSIWILRASLRVVVMTKIHDDDSVADYRQLHFSASTSELNAL